MILMIKIMEEEETAAMFQKDLNVDQDVAKILAEEGFTSIDEIAYVILKNSRKLMILIKKLVDELEKKSSG